MTRFDISMRIRIDAESYQHVGGLMDEIQAHVSKVLKSGHTLEHGKADFVSFNTNPCKAAAFDQGMYPPDVPQLHQRGQGEM